MHFGLKYNRLRSIRRAGSNRRGILVLGKCDCGKQHVAVLSEVLSGHTKSCGCLKHQRYVEHIQRTVSRLGQDTIMQCFLHLTGDKDTPRPDLRWEVIRSAFYRRTEQLKSLPDGTTLAIKNCVLAGHEYNKIATMTGRHRSEIGWLAKHVIRPEARRDREEQHSALVAMKWYRMGRSGETSYLSSLVKPTYLERKRLHQLLEGRFSASELHNTDSKVARIARLDPDSPDSAWHWIKTKSAGVKLSLYQQGLVDWFRETAERTERYRKQQYRRYLRRTRHRVPSVAGRNS